MIRYGYTNDITVPCCINGKYSVEKQEEEVVIKCLRCGREYKVSVVFKDEQLALQVKQIF